MTGTTYDYQRIYEELKRKIEEIQKFTSVISTDSLLYYTEELEQKYGITYSNDDLPF